MIAALWRRLRHPDAVSLDWLREQDRRDNRVPSDGVAITWPINKLVNESPTLRRQATALRRQAA